jgi:hypothetical protein
MKKWKEANRDLIDYNLDKSLSFYDRISENYLKGDIIIGQGADVKSVPRSRVYKHLGLVSLTNRWDPFHEYNTLLPYKEKAIFFNYVVKKKGLENFYLLKDEDAETLNLSLLAYYTAYPLILDAEKVIDLTAFNEVIAKKRLPRNIDKNALLAFLSVYYSRHQQKDMARKFIGEVELKHLVKREKIKDEDNSYRYYKLMRSLLNYYWSQPVTVETGPAESIIVKGEDYYKGFELLKLFPDAHEQRNALLANIDSLQRGGKDLVAFVLMDSLVKMHLCKSPKFGNKLFEILGRMSTGAGDNLAMGLMKDKSDRIKPVCLNLFLDGKAEAGNYFSTTRFIPDYISSSSQLSIYSRIVKNEALKRRTDLKDGWSGMDHLIDEDRWLATISGLYEDSEDGGFYYSTEDD